MAKSLQGRLRSALGRDDGRPRAFYLLTSIAILAASLLLPLVNEAQTRAPVTSRTQSHVPPEAQQLAAQAQDAVSHGDYARAIDSYQKLERIIPNVPEIHADLATAYYSAGRFEDASNEARTALKVKPSLVNAQYVLDVSMAEGGHCPDAIANIERDYPRANGPLKLALGLDGLRCGMAGEQSDRALEFARWLNHDYPDNPDVLYLSTHFYSDLSDDASQRLLAKAPNSYQAHQMSAEVLEMQDKPKDAIDEYRKVLAMNPHLPGIHFEIGRLLLQGQPSAADQAQARNEFEAELKIDPNNPGVQGELGEMAWQTRNWDDAIARFRAALKIDAGDEEALVGLGKSLVSAGRASEAVGPLEMASKMAPGDPTAHYQLSFAYRHLGRAADADREMAAYRKAYDQVQQANQATRSGLAGDMNAKP